MCGVGAYHLYSMSGGSSGVPGCEDCFGYMLCSIYSLSEIVRLGCGGAFTPYGHTKITEAKKGQFVTLKLYP